MAIEFNVDSQVRPYATLSAFPVTGSVKTLYIDESTSDLYYWDGSAYAIVKSQSKYEAIDAINGTGATVLKMSVCYLKTSSSSANTPELLLSNASTEATSSKTIGLLLQDLANGATGKIITSGEYDKFDTSAYNVGDRLWLSTTDGQVTTTIPSAPTHAVFIGFVTRKQSQNGRILVSIQNGYELREIHDVSLPTTPLDGQVLAYDSPTSLWKAKTISTGITIGTTAITSGTVGRVLFEGTGNVVQESANLFWDNTNGRLGIGTSTPSQKLDVVGIIKGTTSAVGTMLDISGVTNSAFNVINDSSGRTFLTVKGNPSATSIGGAFITGEGFQEAWCNVIARQASTGNQYWRFGNLGSSNYFAIQKLNDTATAITLTALTAFSSTGNVGINTTTDAGFKLDVNGTARVSGQVDLAGLTNTQIVTSQQGNSRILQFNNNGAVGGWAGGYVFLVGNNNNYGTATAFRIYSGGRIGIGDITDSNLQNGTAQVFINNQITGGRNAGVRISPSAVSTTEFNGIQFDYGNKDSGGGAFVGSQRNPLTNGYDMDLVVLTSSSNINTYSETARFIGKYNSFYVGTDKTLAVASAKMQVQSTTQGFLPPRMTTTQKNAIASPVAGLQVFDTTLNLMSYYNGTIWISL